MVQRTLMRGEMEEMIKPQGFRQRVGRLISKLLSKVCRFVIIFVFQLLLIVIKNISLIDLNIYKIFIVENNYFVCKRLNERQNRKFENASIYLTFAFSLCHKYFIFSTRYFWVNLTRHGKYM